MQAESNNTTTSRRNLLVAAGSLVAATAAAGTTVKVAANLQEDPIFAAIERHKATVKAYDAHAHLEGELEAIIPGDRRRTTTWDEEYAPGDDPRWIALSDDQRRQSKAETDAEAALVDIIPTTVAGIIALVEHARAIEADIRFRDDFVEDEDDKNGKSWHYFAYGNIAAALKAIAAT